MPSSSMKAGAMAPNDIIAFRCSLSAGECLIGVVASTSTTMLSDGTPAVLVQPRPLLLVPPQLSLTPQQGKKKLKIVKLAGQIVDRTYPAVVGLEVAPIPSPKVSTTNAAAEAAATTVVTADELREMQEQRSSLQADLDTSRARVKEIDDLLRQNAKGKKSSSSSSSLPPSAPVMASPTTNASTAGATEPKSAQDAAKAADAAERELLLARAGLRTVKSVSWSDLQRRTQHTSSPALVRLVETAATLLHDPLLAGFDDAVVQSATLAKRLASVKSLDVTHDDRAKAQSFLQAWPTARAVEKEHRTAPALHRWLAAILKASQAQVELGELNMRENPSRPSGGSTAAANASKSAASPDLSPSALGVLTPDAEADLRNERADQLEYIEMAEEEVIALDALIAEAQTLATSRPSSPVNGRVAAESELGSATVVPALTVPVAWVVCTFASSDAPDMAACATKPRGTPVTFSLPENHALSVAVKTASAANAATARAAAKSGATSPRGSQARPAVSEAGSTMPVDVEGNATSSTLPATTISSHRASGLLVSPRPSFSSPAQEPASDAALSSLSEIGTADQKSAKPREEKLEEKVRLLEARLSAALQQNPKEAELQLLRDEVSAKRAEVQRVTEERDRLLLERREKSMWGYGALGRRKVAESTADGGARDNTNRRSSEGNGGLVSPTQQPGSGRYARQLSSPRDVVDRGVVDELEEQLTAAHQRIAELQMEASQAHRRPSVSPAGVHAADAAAVSMTLFSAEQAASEASPFGVEAPHGSPLKLLAPSPPPPAAQGVAQEAYDELEARLQSATAALEVQRQHAQRLEEQLNSALHRRTEAEGVVAAQKRELEEVWERLEAAEARADEHSLLTEQRLLMAQAQQQLLLVPVQNVAPSSVSTAEASQKSPQQGALVSSGLPRRPAQPAVPPREPFRAFTVPSMGDADVKSLPNDDNVTVVTGTGGGNVSRLSFDAPPRGASADAFPSFTAGLHVSTDAPLQNSPYGRGASAALQTRPVEQLSTIELRHEVHRLREEIERHQSGEMRLAMELQTIREKQKAEHKRRRDARVARMQMLTRMQDSITEAIEKSNQDLEAIPALLERGRAEAEALTLKRRMHR